MGSEPAPPLLRVPSQWAAVAVAALLGAALVLHVDLENDPDVGSVISIALLMAETDRHWLAFLVSWEGRLERLEQPKHGRVGRSFVSEDRRLGRFLLRMRERGRDEPRQAIVERLAAHARRHGFEVELAGGLFKLQGELSQLARNGVLRGLGGLMAAFFLITALTSRSLPTALAMTACLALIPLALYGIVAVAGVPLDIVAAPAVNVALPLGIDEMIHLGYAMRRSRVRARERWNAWREALEELWLPILASASIVGAGFSLFTLSRFPPTHRLGLLISIGVVLTDLVVLVVLPALATITLRRARSRERRAAAG